MSKFAPPPSTGSGATIMYTPTTVAGGAAAGAAAGSLTTTLSGTVSWSVLAGAVAVNASTGVLTTTGTAPASTSGATIAAAAAADNGSNGVILHINVPVSAATATLYPAYKPALAATVAGTSRTVIHAISDSTGAGFQGGTTADGLNNNARAGAYPAVLAGLFVSSKGLPSAGHNFIGNAGGTSRTQSQADLKSYDASLYDDRWTASALVSLGGCLLYADAGSNAIVGYLGSYDTLDLIYPSNSALNPALKLERGSSSTIVNEAVASGVHFTTFTGTDASGAGIAIDQNNGSGVGYVIGFAAYNVAQKAVHVFNSGWCGSSTVDWTETSSSAFSAFSAMAVIPAKLTIINLGLNDMNQGIALSTSQANLQALITQAKLSGDVLLMNPNRTVSTYASDAVQSAYASMTAALASSNGTDYLDIASISGFSTYAAAQAAAYMNSDGIHPNASGYAVIANAIFNKVGNPT